MIMPLFYSIPFMKENKITALTRILLFICGLGLIAVLFTPMWRIDLQAPQYPEGLRMLIYPHKLAGNIDIINGLNHYIGMKTLHTNDFPEFKILPAIIIIFSLLFILVGIIAKRRLLYLLLLMFVSFGVIAMIDFWRWEYNYGHNLNPDAAIIVPGMSYQPPLVGYKQLLNFGAYSVPDIGGWIFVAVGALLLFCVIYEFRRQKKQGLFAGKQVLPLTAVLLLFVSSCNTKPEAIRIGKDNCDFCKMTISDKRFGAEIVTKKSKVHKFDDEHCVVAFLRSAKLAPKDISGIYFVDFSNPNDLIKVEDAVFLQSPLLKSPMNGNIAAFSSNDSLIKNLSNFYGNRISWEDMQK